MPSLIQACHRNGSLTCEQQAKAVKFIPMAMKIVLHKHLKKYPAWLMKLMGHDDIRGQAMLGLVEAAAKHKPKKGKMSTVIWPRTKKNITDITRQTLRQCGARPNQNGMAQQSPVVLVSQNENIEQAYRMQSSKPIEEPLPNIKLAELIADLPERSRKIVELRMTRGLNHNQIGRLLGFSGEWVRRQFNQALKQLAGSERFLKLAAEFRDDITLNGKIH